MESTIIGFTDKDGDTYILDFSYCISLEFLKNKMLCRLIDNRTIEFVTSEQKKKAVKAFEFAKKVNISDILEKEGVNV